MGKRKRPLQSDAVRSSSRVPDQQHPHGIGSFKKVKNTPERPIALQIIAGTYERILHGITATVTTHHDQKTGDDADTSFTDAFLFNAHGSAVRCLALSPPSQDRKVILASGGSDQIINLYHLSARRLSRRSNAIPSLPSVAGRKIVEDPKNRELGSLQHHAASISALAFPTRSKFLSAADDNTIAVIRTRDWTVLSTIKIPIPKAHGRPSGDTAPLGGTPAGVNDFAVHPSMKLMVSVSKGEKCMRLWNLVTGKKAGVLNFDKVLLQAVGEGRWGRGEGYRVEWDSVGEEFVVAFERGAAVFGLDSKPKGVAIASPLSKFLQVHYVNVKTSESVRTSVLAASTADGRILFFSTRSTHESNEATQIPGLTIIGQLGGGSTGPGNRIKDFEHLEVPETHGSHPASLVVTASSEGSVCVWLIDLSGGLKGFRDDGQKQGIPESIPQLGRLLGKYETGNRITCLKAFVMEETAEGDDVPRSALADTIANTNEDHISKDSSA
ncbi:MAG: hypothetical protein Q9220_007142 [cf. Caloplaca sp. 1 TL-2023]